ncbi:MAG TPA: NFACT family protein [Chloroflexota bacterium]
MSFDALTLSAVRDELEPLLTDARLQKIVFVDELSVAFEAFAPRAGRTCVLLSAHLERNRVQRLAQLPARGLEADTPFSLLMRKHLRSARIRSVQQPRLERVFELDCEQRDASGRFYRVLLIVEAMGRRSNLVLVDDDGTLIDAARRAPPSRNPRRPLLPHLPYTPPPAQDRLFPEQVSAASLAPPGPTADSHGRPAGLGKYLAERLAGLSPLAGRELAFRAVGSTDAPLLDVDWGRVAAVAREFVGAVDTHAWQPSLAFDAERPLEFAPYVLSHLAATGARIQRFDSISDAMQVYYTHLSEHGLVQRGDALAAERKALLGPIDRAARTTARRIAALRNQLEASQRVRDPMRRVGEALLARQAQLPLGTPELWVDGERFDLDPLLSAVDNAQAYFARYRKAREAESRVPPLLEEARHAEEHLAELRALVEVADRMDAIRALRREVVAATGSPKPAPETRPRRRGRAPEPRPALGPYRRVTLADGWEGLVGMSATGNAAVTFEVATADDLWLHARGVPGAHVIVRTRGGEPPPAEVVERAAELAAAQSAARAAAAVEVDITSRRYVKKVPGGPPGLVRYTHERTVRVAPRPGERPL